MMPLRLLAAFAAVMLVPACNGGSTSATTDAAVAGKTLPVTVAGPGGSHRFQVELARTEAEQQRGLMFRTDIPEDGGMLFAPYPPDGSAPREASFWMKNTPTPLDIIYIRPDHTIARIAENTTPFSQTPIRSGEPVGAILELRGGRAAALGIDEDDQVSWPGQ